MGHNHDITVGTQDGGGGTVLNGFSDGATFPASGACNPIDFFLGGSIGAILWGNQDPTGGIILVLNGAHTNTGWTTIKIGNQTLNRADATFSDLGTSAFWQFVFTGADPFAAVGQHTTVTFA